MTPWIKHWHDWATVRELLWPFHRGGGPHPQGLVVGYEKAGTLVRGEPVPWNADSVVVEALLRFPGSVVRRKSDFALRPLHSSIAPAVTAVTLHRHDGPDLYRLLFRLPPLRQATTVELAWKGHALARATLPFLSADEFIDHLQVRAPTTFVRLSEQQTVACQAFLYSQCHGLLAGGLLTSPTSLAPLFDLDLAVDFHDRRTGATQRAPVRLASSQLAGNEALTTVVAPRRPKRVGDWSVEWTLAGRVLARRDVRVLGRRALRGALHVADTRYVLQGKDGSVTLTRHLPAAGEGSRLGPCFLVANRVPGMAVLVPLEVRAQAKAGNPADLLPLFADEVLLTDGPLPLMPGTVDMLSDLPGIVAFELTTKGQPLGFLSTCPAPVAAFTTEGGFRPPADDYLWGHAADEELSDRLGKLTEMP